MPGWYQVLRTSRLYAVPVWDVSTAYAEHGEWAFAYLRAARYLGVPFPDLLDRVDAGEHIWVYDALNAEHAEYEAEKTLAKPD